MGRTSSTRERQREEDEGDYGVPFPGRPVPHERWTVTRADLPPPGALFDWEAVFGRAAPRVVDLGCGNGRFLVASAIARPGHDHLGIDLVPQAIHHARRRAGRRGLANVRFAMGDAAGFLEQVAPGSLSEIHLYHPQPYFDEQRRERRMISPEFVATAHRALASSGFVVLQSDNPAYWRYIERTFPVLFDWRRQAVPWPDAPEGRTRREILARQRGMPIYRATGMPRPLPPEEVAAIVARLPRPEFDAASLARRKKRARRRPT